ncbi:LCP family protein [Dermacoccaceae bacterium W4C1]
MPQDEGRPGAAQGPDDVTPDPRTQARRGDSDPSEADWFDTRAQSDEELAGDGGDGGDGDTERTEGAAAAGSRRSRRGKRRKKRNPFAVLALVLLTMCLIVGLVIGGFALYLNHVFDSGVRRAGLLPDGENRVSRDAAAGDAQNILLLGSDSRTEELRDASRADVIQLVHIPADRSSVQIIHFPRDLYVDIPGRGKNKINAAYAFGGSPLLVQTMEKMLNVRIDHVAAIGFDGFKRLTNTIGGVDVKVDQASSRNGYTFTPGTMHMSGDQALAFVQERKQLQRGDIDRGRRQQAWIKGLLNKATQTGTLSSPTRLASMVGDVAQNLVVDDSFTTGDMRSLAWSLRSVRGNDVTFLTAPYSGFESIQGVGAVDIVDEAGMTKLGTALRTDKMSTLPGQITDPG